MAQVEQVSTAVRVEVADDVAVVTMDDGKANAVGHDMVGGLHAALDLAEDDAKAVVLAGREGKFCAGFDLGVMAGDDAGAARDLLEAGAMICHRLFLHPQPVVAAATGHALALGAIMLMSCDVRYGVDGPFKLGTNEVAIGMPLPRFGVTLARERLSKRHLQAAVHHARVYNPSEAVDAGYLDQLVPAEDLVPTAVAYAASMAQTLHPEAFRRTRAHMRDQVASDFLVGLAADLDEVSQPD